jgi:hypothetical protein
VDIQRFERNRLELHPENARPYDVLVGRLGADRLAQQGRDWFGFAKNGDTGGCKVFTETGHAVCGAVLNAWRKSGLKLDTRNAVSEAESLALFGLPLSDLQTETMADGQQYQVQWFERARFELHPENSAPYDVLLGLLGNEVGVLSSTQTAPQKNPLYEWQILLPKNYWADESSWGLKLLNFRYETTSKNDYDKPKSGYSFLIVNMQVYRIGKVGRIADYNLHVFDSNGQVLRNTYLSRLRDCYLDATLLPDGQATGCIGFEVPNSGKIELVYAPNKDDIYIPGRYLSWIIRP